MEEKDKRADEIKGIFKKLDLIKSKVNKFKLSQMRKTDPKSNAKTNSDGYSDKPKGEDMAKLSELEEMAKHKLDLTPEESEELLITLKKQKIGDLTDIAKILDLRFEKNLNVSDQIMARIKSIFSVSNIELCPPKSTESCLPEQSQGLFGYLSDFYKEIGDPVETGIISKISGFADEKPDPNDPNRLKKPFWVDLESTPHPTTPHLIFKLNFHEINVSHVVFTPKTPPIFGPIKAENNAPIKAENNAPINAENNGPIKAENNAKSAEKCQNSVKMAAKKPKIFDAAKWIDEALAKDAPEFAEKLEKIDSETDLSEFTETRLDGSDDGKVWHSVAKRLERASSGDGLIRGETDAFYKFFRIVKSNDFMPIDGPILPHTLDLYGTLRPLRNTDAVFLKHEHDFDTNGAVYYFGTRGHTRAWANPAATGALAVRCSGLSENCDVAHVVGRTAERCISSRAEGSWFLVDLGPGARLAPNKYTLRHYDSFDLEALRHWALQGSDDGKEWRDLRVHSNDRSLGRKGQSCSWDVAAAQGRFFRMFRVLQTGLNSNNHSMLALSGFEVYGAMRLERDKTEPITLNDSNGANAENAEIDIFDYFATDGGRAPPTNPILRRAISVRCSDPLFSHDQKIELLNASGKCRQFLINADEAEAVWITFEFLAAEVKPSRYVFYANWFLDFGPSMNYDLSGSNDNANWDVIETRENGSSFEILNESVALECSAKGFYKYLRLRKLSPEPLLCKGVKFFGEIRPLRSSQMRMSKSVDRILSSPMWDPLRHTEFIQISDSLGSVTKTGCEEKWEIALSKKVCADKRLRCDVTVLNEGYTTNEWRTVIGLVPDGFDVQKEVCIGMPNGWGYIANGDFVSNRQVRNHEKGHPYSKGDTIGITVDFDDHTLTFHRNGVKQPVVYSRIPRKVRVAVCFVGMMTSARLAVGVLE